MPLNAKDRRKGGFLRKCGLCFYRIAFISNITIFHYNNNNFQYVINKLV